MDDRGSPCESRTILITVLTNSFMAIASNATEEHQYEMLPSGGSVKM